MYDSSLTIKCRIQSAIHSVLTVRVILNIREAASRRLDDISFDLHLSDIEVSGSRISFAENLAVFHFDDDYGNVISPRRERFSGVGAGQVGTVSISDSTQASHVTLPMARVAKGKGVVGRLGPDGDKDDYDKGSNKTYHEEWV